MTQQGYHAGTLDRKPDAVTFPMPGARPEPAPVQSIGARSLWAYEMMVKHGLSASETLVLWAVMLKAGPGDGNMESGSAYASQASLAAELPISERTVWGALARLCDLGLLTARRRFGRSTVYRRADPSPAKSAGLSRKICGTIPQNLRTNPGPETRPETQTRPALTRGDNSHRGNEPDSANGSYAPVRVVHKGKCPDCGYPLLPIARRGGACTWCERYAAQPVEPEGGAA